MTGNALVGATLLLVLGGAGAETPAPKPFQKRLKAASIDPAKKTISVREPDLEVVWDEKTRFLVHRSARLKELKRGAPVHILGRLHSVRSTGTPVSDSVIAEVAFLGTGEAYEPPPLTPRGAFVRWHAGTLESTEPTLDIRIGDFVHRLAVDDAATVYSLEKAAPVALPGKSIVVRGRAEPAAGAKDAKRRRGTRVLATEVHLLELNPEHTKVFQLQWGEVRKPPFGLRGEYFDDQNLRNLKVTRVDSNVNFDWGTGSPDNSVEPDSFSARWTGHLTAPSTGSFNFHVSTDDGVRLWVDRQLLIDKWQSPTEATATLALEAGKKYEIRMEYFEGIKGAFAKLYWSGPSLPKEIIPHTVLSPPPAAAETKAATK
jgi:hypothetical protein